VEATGAGDDAYRSSTPLVLLVRLNSYHGKTITSQTIALASPRSQISTLVREGSRFRGGSDGCWRRRVPVLDVVRVRRVVVAESVSRRPPFAAAGRRSPSPPSTQGWSHHHHHRPRRLHRSRSKFGTSRYRRCVPFSDQISTGPGPCRGRVSMLRQDQRRHRCRGDPPLLPPAGGRLHLLPHKAGRGGSDGCWRRRVPVLDVVRVRRVVVAER
jgi:hypothetical protein